VGPKREPVPIWPTHTLGHCLLSTGGAAHIPNLKMLEILKVGTSNLGTSNPKTYLYFFAGAAAISSITRACEPPRSYNLPFAVTLPPANAINFAFCPVAGVVSAIGQ
jgi:hypothetical protein